MTKKVITSPQEALLRGAKVLEQAVASTLGPKGRTVIIEDHQGKALVTKDGVTVAHNITLEDPVENFGAMLIKQAAQMTARKAGDGTTTSTIIATALATAAYEEVAAGRHAIDIKREIDTEVDRLITHLNSISTSVTLEDILPIATISANNDSEIGELIHKAYEYVSLQGLIALEESKTGKSHITLNEGYKFDRGFVSPFMVTDKRKQEAIFEDPLIFIAEKKLRTPEDVETAMRVALQRNQPLLIIADEIEIQALQMILANVLRGTVKVCAVKSPSYGLNRSEVLRDIAALTSSTVLSDKEGMDTNVMLADYLGTAKKVIITADSTTIIDGKSSPEVKTRIEMIENQLLKESVDDYTTTQLTGRLAGLTAKVAVLHVGAATESELAERKARVDDALRATRSAIVKGYVLGAGRTLFDLAAMSKSPVLKTALIRPIERLAVSVNFDFDSLVLEMTNALPAEGGLKSYPYGLNAKTGKIENLAEAKIFDPTLVLEQAIINAASAASMILLSSTVVHNVDRTPPYNPGSLDDLSA